jgi:hypothetical protein
MRMAGLDCVEAVKWMVVVGYWEWLLHRLLVGLVYVIGGYGVVV